VKSAAILGISGGVAVFDERVAHWTQTSGVQGSTRVRISLIT
jgi:hypothetical protein